MKKLLFLLVSLFFAGGCYAGGATVSVGIGVYYGHGYPAYQQPYYVNVPPVYPVYQQPQYVVNPYYVQGVPCCTFPLMGYGPGYFVPGPGNTYSPYNFVPAVPANAYGVPQMGGPGFQGNTIVPGSGGYVIHRRDRIR